MNERTRRVNVQWTFKRMNRETGGAARGTSKRMNRETGGAARGTSKRMNRETGKRVAKVGLDGLHCFIIFKTYNIKNKTHEKVIVL